MRRPLSRTLALQGLQGAPGALARRARAMPSLDLRFAETKSLTDAISGQNLITFTRASSATVINAAGALETVASNVPRFDHNPLTGESLGLLVEDQRTNLNTNSEAFDTYSITSATVSANQGAAPNGSITADEITSNGGGAFKNISGTTASASFTASVYAKYVSGGGNFVFGFDANPSSGRSSFNLQNGTIVSNEVNATASSITAVGSGWYRCVVTATVTSTNAILVFYNATSGAKWLCWGAQLEAGADPTSYIPTTGAAATRSADVASITEANFSSWASASTHTLFAEIRRSSAVNANTQVASFSDGTLNNRFGLRLDANGITSTLTSVNSGVLDGVVQVATGVAGSNIRQIGAAELNNYQLAVNGVPGTTDTAALVPTVNQFEIGQVTATEYFNGTIRRLTYWPQRLPNNSLVAITR